MTEWDKVPQKSNVVSRSEYSPRARVIAASGDDRARLKAGSFFTSVLGGSVASPVHRGPDRRTGLTAAEIAQMSGVVSRPTVASVAAIAAVPGHDVRRGIAQENGERMATAMSVGLLTERSARAISADPQAVIRAAQDLQALVWEIMRHQYELNMRGEVVEQSMRGEAVA